MKTKQSKSFPCTLIAFVGACMISACGGTDPSGDSLTHTGRVTAALTGDSDDTRAAQSVLDLLLNLGISWDGEFIDLESEITIDLEAEFTIPLPPPFACERKLEINRSLVCTDLAGNEQDTCNEETNKVVANYTWKHVLDNCLWERSVLASGDGTITVDGLQTETVNVTGNTAWERSASIALICDGALSYSLEVESSIDLVLSRELCGIQSGSIVHTFSAQRSRTGCLFPVEASVNLKATFDYERKDGELKVGLKLEGEREVNRDLCDMATDEVL